MGAMLLLLLVMAPMMGSALMADDGAGHGSDDSERLDGTDDNDVVYGNGGNDLLVGFQGNDHLEGGDGHDWILGLTGDDTMIGGDGVDVIVAGDGADQVYAGAGDDFVEAAEIVDTERLVASLDGLSSVRDLDFAYDYEGPDQGDMVELGAGDDTVVAGDDDTVTGGDGKDEFVVGDWSDGDDPVIITDYDPQEDIITFSYDQGHPPTDVEVELDSDTGDALLIVDGVEIAVIRGAGASFGPDNIAMTHYRP